MEQVRYHQVVSPEIIDQAKQLAERIPPRFLLRAAGVLATLGILSATFVQPEESHHAPRIVQRACIEDCAAESGVQAGDQRLPEQRPTTVPTTVPETTSLPTTAPNRIRAASLLSMPLLNYIANPKYVHQIEPGTQEALNRMHLTAEGYQAFLASIDYSQMPNAQGYPEFNPRQVAIKQGKTQFFTWHFTAFYRNMDGPSPQKNGDVMDIPDFVKGLAERGDHDVDKNGQPKPPDHICCAVNWIIDRNGIAHQLAPFTAKLRHNAPFDAVTTGVEIEATFEHDLTTKQLESAAYLTGADLHNEGILDPMKLEDEAQGHGETRDRYMTAYPHSEWGQRNDFDQPLARALRLKLFDFLIQNPGVTDNTPHFQ